MMAFGGGASMKCREFICILGGIAAGFWPGRGTIIAAMAAMVLLPIEVSDAGRLSHIFKSSSKHGKSPKHVTSPKPHTVKLAALGPVALNLSPVATMCDPSKFRIVLDVGHRRIRRRDQRPQRRRVRLQSAPCAADRGEIEGRRLC